MPLTGALPGPPAGPQVIAMGFLLDSTSYMKDGWNILDFAVVTARPQGRLPYPPGPSFSSSRCQRPGQSPGSSGG